jgi:hypothetical protein
MARPKLSRITHSLQRTPLSRARSDAGSGAAAALAAGILFTPVVHRMLHWFHLEEARESRQ